MKMPMVTGNMLSREIRETIPARLTHLCVFVELAIVKIPDKVFLMYSVFE